MNGHGPPQASRAGHLTAGAGAASAEQEPAPLRSATAIRGGALRVLGYGAGVLVSLAAASVLVRHLGIQGFGRYVTVTSLVALVGGLTEAGIVVYGIREFVARDEPARQRLLANLLAMRLCLALVGVAIAVCFGLIAGYREALVLGTLVAGAALLAQVVTDVLSIPLQARLLLGRLTVVELSRRALTLIGVSALALAGAGLLGMLAASTVAAALALVLIAWIVRSHATIRLSFDWQVWRKLFTDTLPYAIALSVAAIYVYVTVIVMSLIASSTQTGLFATSFRVTQVGLAIPSLLLTAVFPLMSDLRGDRSAAGAAVGRVFGVAAVVGVWMSLALTLGASFVVQLIAGHAGRGAIAVLRIQGLVFIVGFVSTSSALALVSLRRYRPLIVVSSCSLALNIVLALLLVPALAARGGALADVLAEALVALGYTVILMRAVPDHHIGAPLVLKPLLAGAASATILLAPIGSLAHALGASVIYLAILLALRAVPHEVLEAARRILLVGRH